MNIMVLEHVRGLVEEDLRPAELEIEVTDCLSETKNPVVERPKEEPEQGAEKTTEEKLAVINETFNLVQEFFDAEDPWQFENFRGS